MASSDTPYETSSAEVKWMPRAKARFSPSVPGRTVLDAAYRDLLSKPNVTGCYVGLKHVDGQPTDRLAIVCCVSEKVPTKQLRRDAGRIPRSVSWQATSKHRRQILTDVIELPQESGRQRPVLGPGDMVEYRPAPSSAMRPGSVGFAVKHEIYGPSVTTAAHLFVRDEDVVNMTIPLSEAPRVRLVNAGVEGQATGRVVRIVHTPTADYAIVIPNNPVEVCNLFADRIPFGGIAFPAASDLGRPLFVATSSGLRTTHFAGYHAHVKVGNSFFQNALLTDRATVGGDSGCAVVTTDSLVCGLLVGFSGPFSVFMSPLVVLTAERSEMIGGDYGV